MEGVEVVFDLSTFEPKGLFEVVDDVELPFPCVTGVFDDIDAPVLVNDLTPPTPGEDDDDEDDDDDVNDLGVVDDTKDGLVDEDEDDDEIEPLLNFEPAALAVLAPFPGESGVFTLVSDPVAGDDDDDAADDDDDDISFSFVELGAQLALFVDAAGDDEDEDVVGLGPPGFGPGFISIGAAA
jgi:hypothetical protein